MKQYHKHLEDILKYGTRKEPAREGMPGSISLFGYQNRYNLQEGFPILTTKKINFKNIVVELLWFLRGDTNIKYLVDNGCNIWNEDAYNYYIKLCHQQGILRQSTFDQFVDAIKAGISWTYLKDPEVPRNYKLGDTGKQYPWLWRSWDSNLVSYCNDDFENETEEGFQIEFDTIDQVKNLIEGLKSNPMGRRHIITAWNPATLDDMALNACHSFVQFNCRKTNNNSGLHPSHADYLNEPQYYLDCQLYQRSADMFLGVPYNISSYALLTEIIAKICNMIPGEFIHTFGDSHIYDNHMDQVNEILSRDVYKYQLPKLKIRKEALEYLNWKDCNLQILNPNDFQLENYQSYPSIKAKLSTGLK